LDSVGGLEQSSLIIPTFGNENHITPLDVVVRGRNLKSSLCEV
jgi:hypothetical protein